VIGHVNPDMDSIAAAIGYAWLLKERDGMDVAPARAGALNSQTTWALEKLGLNAPRLLNDASPRFESVMRRLDTTGPDDPLRDAWAIANRTGGVVPVVNEDGTPYGLITGWSLFTFLTKNVGPNPKSQDITLAELMDSPSREACNTDAPVFKAGTRIRDAMNRILRGEDNDFWVVDEKGQYLGVCRQRDLLEPPRLRLILVDHNEARQALGSLDEAELVEILDHHRLDNPATHIPIRMTVDVVGSTSTLVSEGIEEAGLSAPPDIAGALLAGLCSDTLILTSPTTTDRDHKAAERLGRWAFMAGGPLADEDVSSFGEKLVGAGAGLETRDPDEIVNGDAKEYEAGEKKFVMSQVEVTKYSGLEAVVPQLQAALDRQEKSQGLSFSVLMITNVVRGSSRLLFSAGFPYLEDLPYQMQPDGTRRAPEIVSRKKQLLPVLLGLLEN
jgi:manganese-dependent inorganic pyrophosphatase